MLATGIIALTLVAIVMVIAMVAYTLELLSPSANIDEHRRTLAQMGVLGIVSEKLIPHRVTSPRRFWGTIYLLCWSVLLGMLAFVVWTSDPQYRLKNLLICTALPA